MPYVSSVQPIKSEYQIEEKVNTYFVSDDYITAELGPDYDPPS